MKMNEDKLDALFGSLSQLPADVEYGRVEELVRSASLESGPASRRKLNARGAFLAATLLISAAGVFFFSRTGENPVAAATSDYHPEALPVKKFQPGNREKAAVPVTANTRTPVISSRQSEPTEKTPRSSPAKTPLQAKEKTESFISPANLITDASGMDSGYVYTGAGSWMEEPANNAPPCRPDSLFIAFRNALLSDGLLRDSVQFSFRISNRSLYVNEEKQSKAVAARYKAIYRQQTGRKMRRIGWLEYATIPGCGNCPSRSFSGFRVMNGNW